MKNYSKRQLLLFYYELLKIRKMKEKILAEMPGKDTGYCHGPGGAMPIADNKKLNKVFDIICFN